MTTAFSSKTHANVLLPCSRQSEQSGDSCTPDQHPAGISAIVVTRNRQAALQQMLSNLISQHQHEIDELIVVDNASQDDTATLLANSFPSIRVVSLRENCGIPSGRNIGALRANNEFLLFLDDDGELYSPSLLALRHSLQADTSLAVIGFEVVETSAEGEPGTNSGYKLPASPQASPSLTPTYTFSGGAVLLKRSVFLKVGMFPEDFFYSHEEDDLSYRMIAKGYRIALCIDTVFLHYRLTKRSMVARQKRMHYYYQNRLRVIWRNLPLSAAIRETCAAVLGGVVRTAFTRFFLPFLTGTLATLRDLGTTLRSKRNPLSREQYRTYQQLLGNRADFGERFRNLLTDIWTRQRHDWI